jgi:hypothetical protein
VENEADWFLGDRIKPHHEPPIASSSRQALAELFVRDIMDADALGSLEPHVVQKVLHYVVDLMDGDEPLAPWHPVWKTWEYYEILDALYGSYSEHDEPGEVLNFADGQIKKLSKQYQFKDVSVEEFLRENGHLTELLLEAREKIREYFGEDVPAALDIVKERDAKNSGRLFVLILTTLPPAEALSRLDELDQGWWIEALSASRSKVTIDIDYG